MNSFKIITLIFWFIIAPVHNLFSQENEEILATYDSIIGKENLPITNGLFHYNNFRINDNKDIYYINQNFTIGSLNYLSQTYTDLNLKYDSLNDELVYRPTGKSEKTGINLIKSNVSSFHLNGLNFVNLDILKTEKPESIKGFYEEKIKNNTLAFYIKHYKSKREIFINKKVFIEFSDEEIFVVYTKNKYFEISSKSSIVLLFPENKKLIKEYYNNNLELKKKNKALFFSNLLQIISQ